MNFLIHLRVYVVPYSGKGSRLPGQIVVLLDAEQQLVLQTLGKVFPEDEGQGAQHELAQEHEYHQTEIL